MIPAIVLISVALGWLCRALLHRLIVGIVRAASNGTDA